MLQMYDCNESNTEISNDYYFQFFTHALPFNEDKSREKTLKRIKKSSMNIFSSILNWRKIRHVTMV